MNYPTHEEIAKKAYEIWQFTGSKIDELVLVRPGSLSITKEVLFVNRAEFYWMLAEKTLEGPIKRPDMHKGSEWVTGWTPTGTSWIGHGPGTTYDCIPDLADPYWTKPYSYSDRACIGWIEVPIDTMNVARNVTVQEYLDERYANQHPSRKS